MGGKSGLLVFLILTIVIEVHSDVDDDDDSTPDCMPQLADRCFSEIYQSIPCELMPRISCPPEEETYTTFCRAFEDALDCSSDIIDSGCSIRDGVAVFDTWLKSLRKVHSFFCDNINETLHVIGNYSLCWSAPLFTDCVMRSTEIKHVIDIMHSVLDANKCFFLISTMTECNILSTFHGKDYCTKTHIYNEVVSEGIHTFFSELKCGCITRSSVLKVELSSSVLFFTFLTARILL